MAKKEVIRRKYDVPDSEMIQFTGVYRGIFIPDLPRFQAFDASFNEQYPETWLTAIRNAELAAKDLEVKDELALYTEKVQLKMDECKTHFTRVKYFVGEAWPDNATMQKVFNFDG